MARFLKINADATTSEANTASSVGGAITAIGDVLKTGYNKLMGYTKIDNRPTAGATNSYAFQVRSESGNTTGQQWGIDCEAHLKATGTADVRAVQGVAVLDTGFTGTGVDIIGVYGQARADGTVVGDSFLAGLYGLIEAGAAITATHVTSLWLDTHQANAVTGSYQLMYLTENGAAPLDQVMYLRTPAAAAFAEFEQCDTFVSDNAQVGGTAKKIKITIDGVAHYINAYTG